MLMRPTNRRRRSVLSPPLPLVNGRRIALRLACKIANPLSELGNEQYGLFESFCEILYYGLLTRQHLCCKCIVSIVSTDFFRGPYSAMVKRTTTDLEI